MKHIFELNSRATIEDSAESKHDRLVECLKTIEKPWGIDKSLNIPFPGFGEDFTAILNLDNFFECKIKATLFYRYRNRLEDDSSCDDRMYIEFSTKNIEYTELVSRVASKYVKCFNPYFASIYNEKVIFEDFEKTRFKNFRREIVRFSPFFYLDEDLCRNALGLSLIEVKNRLEKLVEKVDFSNGGLFVLYTSKPLSLKDSNDADKSIREALKIE